MKFPAEDDLRRERRRFMRTIETLTDEEFEHGATLCTGWAPRDVLAHIVGADRMSSYLRPSGLTINRGNAAMVRKGRALSRAELTRMGWDAAEKPRLGARLIAWILLHGDVVMHHQDVLRGLGRPYDLPAEANPAIMREATIWHFATLLRYRLVPSDGKPRGRGREVRGTTEALAMWLGGRDGIEAELHFS